MAVRSASMKPTRLLSSGLDTAGYESMLEELTSGLLSTNTDMAADEELPYFLFRRW